MDCRDKRECKTLLMVPFASDPRLRTGANMEKTKDYLCYYMKNCCVSLTSAKHYNPGMDVALVTNIEVENEYRQVLERAGVLVIHVPFSSFRFGEGVTWGLAFYKLCAMYELLKQGKYEYYIWLDSDVYVQFPLREMLPELDQSILIWDHMHGLQSQSYLNFLQEVHTYTKSETLIPHYGGELFACNREQGLPFLEQALQLFQEMKARAWETKFGDEFITSIVASRNKDMVKHAGAYIFRFWTGTFRLVSTRYKVDPVLILHVPAEKKTGMIALYDRYISKGKLPPREVAWRLLHLSRWGVVNRCKYMAKKLLGRK